MARNAELDTYSKMDTSSATFAAGRKEVALKSSRALALPPYWRSLAPKISLYHGLLSLYNAEEECPLDLVKSKFDASKSSIPRPL